MLRDIKHQKPLVLLKGISEKIMEDILHELMLCTNLVPLLNIKNSS